MSQDLTPVGRPITDLINKTVLVRHVSYNLVSYYCGVLTRADAGGIVMKDLKRVIPNGRQVIVTAYGASVMYWLIDLSADTFPLYSVTVLKEVFADVPGDLDRKVTEMVLENQ